MSDFAEWLRGRSLWQVLGVYLAGSWVGFEITATVTEALQLPVWLPRGALILIAAGLPIVIAAVLLRRREGVFTLGGALIMGAAAFSALFAAAGLSSVFVSQTEQTSTDPAAGSVEARGVVYTNLADDPRPAIAVLPFLDLSPARFPGRSVFRRINPPQGAQSILNVFIIFFVVHYCSPLVFYFKPSSVTPLTE